MVSGSPQSTIGRFVGTLLWPLGSKGPKAALRASSQILPNFSPGYISCSYKRIFIIVALYLVASVLLLAAQPSARQDPRSASLSKITKQWSVPPNHHIIISSSWLDPHNKLESLRKLTSDLIVLASRTNRFAYYLRLAPQIRSNLSKRSLILSTNLFWHAESSSSHSYSTDRLSLQESLPK